MRWSRGLSGMLVIWLAVATGWGQLSKGPQVSIRVPASVVAEGIEAKIFMGGPFGGYGNYLLPKPGMERYVFDASVDGVAATSVQAVVYMPGCELSKFQSVMHGENVERQMECRPMSQWSLVDNW
jgi:hypothetical protein